MIDVFKTLNLLVILIASVAVAAVLTVCAKKIFAALQQLNYNTAKFIKWTKKPGNMIFSRLILLSFLIFLSFSVLNLSLSFAGREVSSLVGFAMYFLFLGAYVYADKKYALKVPFKNTARMKRLKIAFFALFVLLSVCLMLLFSVIAYYAGGDVVYVLRFAPLSILPALCPFVCALACLINKSLETPKNKKFVTQAAQKLRDSQLKIVGITGSFGKTSVKNILKTLLSSKYRVLATPDSYNTPLGLALTVNNSDLSSYDIFLAEMGAKNVGDIAELCAIAPPYYSVVTGIGPQHLESFITPENILSTKFEIVENTAQGGAAVFGESAKELYERCKTDKTLTGKEVYIKDLKLSPSGSEFMLCSGEERKKVKTKLLGAHNAGNIALAAALCLKMGMTLKEICAAAQNIEFEKHRLELIKAPNGLNVLDDSYNANTAGAAAALEVLKLFPGKKAAVTPGIVELGILEYEENYKLGKNLAFCDLIILVGETLVASVRDGLSEAGANPDNIFTVPELSRALPLISKYLKSGDTVLFLNDLPDIYR